MIMYQLVFVLAILLMSNSACRVNGECTGGCRNPDPDCPGGECLPQCSNEGAECDLDESCCTGFCDWKLGDFLFTGLCAPRPYGPLPSKPCIPVGSGQTCYHNVTCCRGYCETRYTLDGFCTIESPGFGLPPSDPPAPIATEIAPVSAPIATDLSPISSPIATPLTPANSPLPTDLAPILPPIIPPYDVSVPAPTPAWSKIDGRKKKLVAPTKAPSKKDKTKHKPVAPAPAKSKKGGRKIKQKKKHKSESVTCTKAPAPPPAY